MKEGPTMNIALIGYGKMGHEVEALAIRQGHRVVAKCDPIAEGRTSPVISDEALQEATVCIEFTHPAAVLGNIRQTALLRKSLVVGTTGWTDHLTDVETLVRQQQIGLVYAPNFSLGVNLFYRIAARAAELFNRFEDYDVFGSEIHHRHKADSPSGTARRLASLVLDNFTRKKKVVTGMMDRPMAPDEFHLTSARAGEFPGIHSLTFDSLADTIELTHTVRSRSGFARGALLAAEWIAQRKGIFSFEEILDELLGPEAARS
jgi:4-hydroxy-tetrahydrodipicolinate reductase